MSPRCARRYPTARGAREEAYPHEEGLHDRLDGFGLLTDRNGQGIQADRSPAEPGEDDLHHLAVEAVETNFIHVVQFQGRVHGGEVGVASVHKGVVAYAAKQTIGYSGCAAAPAGDLGGPGGRLED